jgi:hypothetical protein
MTASLETARAFALAVIAVTGAGAVATACNARIVDVGTNDAGLSSPSSSVVVDGGIAPSQYGCTEWIDDEVVMHRQGACGGQCPSTPALPYALDSKADVIAATAGQWMYCAGTLGPADAVGIEFAPGCRLFFLRPDSSGVIVRGTEASYQATYDIYDPQPAGMPRRIDIHISDASTFTFDLEAFKCPEHVRLVGSGLTLELAPGFGDAGRPKPEARLTRPTSGGRSYSASASPMSRFCSRS